MKAFGEWWQANKFKIWKYLTGNSHKSTRAGWYAALKWTIASKGGNCSLGRILDELGNEKEYDKDTPFNMR